MSVQRDRKPPVSPKAVEQVNDFSGGHNSTISSTLLNQNEAQVARNVSLEQKGTLKPRPGSKKRYPLAFDVDPVTGVTGYYKKDGTTRLIMAAGTRLFSDKPLLVFEYTERADFEQGTLSEFTAADVVAGELLLVGSLFGTTGNCESITGFTVVDVTLSQDSTAKYGTYGLKASLNTGKTSGKVRLALNSYFLKTTPHAFSLWLRGDATSAKVRLVKTDGTLIVEQTASFSESYTLNLLKASSINMTDAAFLEVELTGTEGKYVSLDGIVAVPITEAQLADSGYVNPLYSAVEPVTTTTDYTFNTGEFVRTKNSGGLTLDMDFVERTTSDVLTDNASLVNTAVLDGHITLAYGVTWETLGLTTVWNTL